MDERQKAELVSTIKEDQAKKESAEAESTKAEKAAEESAKAESAKQESAKAESEKIEQEKKESAKAESEKKEAAAQSATMDDLKESVIVLHRDNIAIAQNQNTYFTAFVVLAGVLIAGWLCVRVGKIVVSWFKF